MTKVEVVRSPCNRSPQTFGDLDVCDVFSDPERRIYRKTGKNDARLLSTNSYRNFSEGSLIGEFYEHCKIIVSHEPIEE